MGDMFWLSTSTVVRLRDQLRAAGQKAAVEVSESEPPSDVALGGAKPDMVLLRTEYGPFCEAMYLMMSADGDVSIEEREVLSGALRNLSGGVLDGELIDKMLEEAARASEMHGRDARLKNVIASLAKEPARAEVAFVLAAAIAFADNTIADEENDTLDAFAEGLGIDESRADDLLDTVEREFGGAPQASEPEQNG